ncbi:uncharacterized protein LOC144254981 [Urocitellus parryii]
MQTGKLDLVHYWLLLSQAGLGPIRERKRPGRLTEAPRLSGGESRPRGCPEPGVLEKPKRTERLGVPEQSSLPPPLLLLSSPPPPLPEYAALRGPRPRRGPRIPTCCCRPRAVRSIEQKPVRSLEVFDRIQKWAESERKERKRRKRDRICGTLPFQKSTGSKVSVVTTHPSFPVMTWLIGTLDMSGQRFF